MSNLLQAVYLATAVLLLAAFVRWIGSRRAEGLERRILAEKARRYFILAGVMGIASAGGYSVLEQSVDRLEGLPASGELSPTVAQDAWTLVPERGAIGVGPDATHESLVAQLGDSVVVRRRIGVGEGATVPGTVLYPMDPSRTLEILWTDTVASAAPERLVVRSLGSRWQLHPGIRIGMPISAVQTSNGGAFTLAGFGWDHAGTVRDWRGGAFTALRGVVLSFDVAPEQAKLPEYQRLLGDADFSSDDPMLRAVDPRVRAFSLVLGPRDSLTR